MVEKKSMMLTPQADKMGYLHVRIYGDDGLPHLRKVHQLVAEAFLGYDRQSYNRYDIAKSLVVHHIDGDKTNNKVENLEIISQLENIRRSRSQWATR